MAYSPKDQTAWFVPAEADGTQWTRLITNNGQLYAEMSAVTIAAVTQSAAITLTTTPTATLRFALPRNKDNTPFSLNVAWTQTGTPGSDSVTLTLDVQDGTDSDSVSVTSTAAGYTSTLNVTSYTTSGSSTPRLCTLKVSGDNSQTLRIHNIFGFVTGTTAASGVLGSGFISVDSLWNAPNAPVPSEICSALNNNVYRLAEDRLCCGVCLVEEDQTNPRSAQWTTDSTSYVLVGRFPSIDVLPGKRSYRIWVVFDSDSGAVPKALVVIGSMSKELSFSDGFGVGVATTTFVATRQELLTGTASGNFVALKVDSGSGNVSIKTFQLFEEAP